MSHSKSNGLDKAGRFFFNCSGLAVVIHDNGEKDDEKDIKNDEYELQQGQHRAREVVCGAKH